MVLYSTFFSLFRTADALMTANARIASLEAELEASRKSWDVSIAAKVAAENSAKLVATKAKKAEKALADADQGRVQREQAITKRLNQISALLVVSIVMFSFCLFAHSSTCWCLLIISCLCLLCFRREHWSILGAFTAG
jgi:hypothetical protein